MIKEVSHSYSKRVIFKAAPAKAQRQEVQRVCGEGCDPGLGETGEQMGEIWERIRAWRILTGTSGMLEYLILCLKSSSLPYRLPLPSISAPLLSFSLVTCPCPDCRCVNSYEKWFDFSLILTERLAAPWAGWCFRFVFSDQQKGKWRGTQDVWEKLWSPAVPLACWVSVDESLLFPSSFLVHKQDAGVITEVPFSWMWWCPPVFPALKRPKEEDQELALLFCC